MPLHRERKHFFTPEEAAEFRAALESELMEEDRFLYMAIDPETDRPIRDPDSDRLDDYRTVIERIKELEPGWEWPKYSIGGRPPKTKAAAQLFFTAKEAFGDGSWITIDCLGERRIIYYEPIAKQIERLKSPYCMMEGPYGPILPEDEIRRLTELARQRGEPV